MKTSALILFLLVPVLAAAQNYQEMNKGDMQKMMQQAQEMQACMENVDQKEMKRLEQLSRQFEAEVKSLCAKGQRDEAQQKAISYGKKMAKDPAVQTVQKCSNIMKDAMPNLPFIDHEDDSSGGHVCDELSSIR